MSLFILNNLTLKEDDTIKNADVTPNGSSENVPNFQNVENLLKIIVDNVSEKSLTLPEKCPYLEFFWSAFSHNRTEYREITSLSEMKTWS